MQGLIPDPSVNPRGVGKYDTVCSTDFAAITLEVRVGRKMVDVDEFASFLKKKNVKPALVDEARAFATTVTKPAHMFSPVWLTSDDNGK